jgi:hypothetical protein
MTRARRTLTALCCVLGFVGCGGTATTDEGTHVSASGKTERAQSSSTRPADTAKAERARTIARARARALSRARAVAAVVRHYYRDVDAKRLRLAWGRLSPAVQAQIGGFETWAAGQRATVEVTVTSVHTERLSKGSASVAVALRSTSVDVCARTVHQRFAGTWTLSRGGRRWHATDLRIEKTGGGTERTDYAQCDGGAGTAPDYSAPVEPDYSAPSGQDDSDTSGIPVPDPGDDPSFCDTHTCIPNYDNGNGSTVQCADGSYSHSGGIQGACSHHGGVG